jgi:hypothetical protein
VVVSQLLGEADTSCSSMATPTPPELRHGPAAEPRFAHMGLAMLPGVGMVEATRVKVQDEEESMGMGSDASTLLGTPVLAPRTAVGGRTPPALPGEEQVVSVGMTGTAGVDRYGRTWLLQMMEE